MRIPDPIVSVRLPASDWVDLINFVGGDLAAMDAADPTAIQMCDICEAIRTAVLLKTK
jgi:hypothetical protein